MSELLDNRDLSLVATGHPVIDNQAPLCTTGQVELKATAGGARRLVIPLTLEEPAKSTDGRELTPGFHTTVGFLVDPSGGWTMERANESLVKFQMAVLGLTKGQPINLADPATFQAFQGKKVRPQFQPQRNDPTRQEVKGWLKA